MSVGVLITWPYKADGRSRRGSHKAGTTVHAEHLKHCSDRIIPMLSKCFTGLLVHGTLPESMIAVVLVPIVKNKRASICSKSNYRPIALASIVSKIFEKLLYDRISYALTTCSNQFGFKTKHSTDMCIYAFKEAVLKYRSLNSNVYSCFWMHQRHLIV